MDIVTIILAIFGSSALTAVLVAYLNRRVNSATAQKLLAEADQTRSSTRQSEIDHYRKRVEDAINQMTVLEAEIRELEIKVETSQTDYEHRIGMLHSKIDNLSAKLDRANKSLDVANQTINELRQKVKDGNSIITELRKEISKLLVDRAEGKARK